MAQAFQNLLQNIGNVVEDVKTGVRVADRDALCSLKKKHDRRA